MAKSRASGAGYTQKIADLRSRQIKDVAKLQVGDYVSMGGKGRYPASYSGYVERIGPKTITVRTKSSMYGEQTIRLPKDQYNKHLDAKMAKELERLINNQRKNYRHV